MASMNSYGVSAEPSMDGKMARSEAQPHTRSAVREVPSAGMRPPDDTECVLLDITSRSDNPQIPLDTIPQPT